LHGKCAGKIYRLLAEHVDTARDGEVVVGDVGFVLNLPYDPERVRAPDVAFISWERIPGGQLPEKFFPGALDLAIQVLSPSDDPVDVQQKVRDWLEGGAKLVWLVALRAKTVTAYSSDGSARFLRGDDSLEGQDILPGLAIPLGTIRLVCQMPATYAFSVFVSMPLSTSNTRLPSMPARSASARIFVSSALSCIGSNLLKSGAIQMGATRLATTMNGMAAAAVYSHHRRGLLRSSRYGTHRNNPPATQVTASAVS